MKGAKYSNVQFVTTSLWGKIFLFPWIANLIKNRWFQYRLEVEEGSVGHKLYLAMGNLKVSWNYGDLRGVQLIQDNRRYYFFYRDRVLTCRGHGAIGEESYIKGPWAHLCYGKAVGIANQGRVAETDLEADIKKLGAKDG